MKMNLGLGLGARQQTVGYDTNASAYFAAMATQGTDAYKAWIDTFITKLVNDRLWSKIAAGWILCNKDTNAAYINIKSPAGVKASPIASPTFVAYEGFNAGGAANTCIDTGLTPVGMGLTETNTGFTIYSRSDTAESKYLLGCSDGTSNILCNPRNGITTAPDVNGQEQNLVNQQSAVAGSYNTPGALIRSDGVHTINRTTAIANQVRSYRNGVLYKTRSGITSRAPQDTRNVYILALNNSGTILGVSSRQISLVIFHAGMSDEDALLLGTHMEWLMANTPAGDKRV